MDDDTPESSTAEQLYRRLGDWIILGHAGCRIMLSRVLARVPYLDQTKVLAYTLFVMVGPTSREYLSTALLDERSPSLVILGEGLLDLPEDEQAEAILPLVARSVLRTRHRLESPPDSVDVSGLIHDKTRSREFDAAMVNNDNASVDHKIDVHFAEKEADALAQAWLARWQGHGQRAQC